MQPDLPEPVVPAISRCGMRARSVQTGGAGDVLAEPDRERARGRRHVVEDVAERDEVRARGSAPRRRPPACRGSARGCGSRSSRARSERSSFSCATLATLVPGRELELVARDARPRDLADHGRLDAEVREALHEHLGDARARLRVRARRRLRLLRAACDPAAGTRAAASATSKSDLLRVVLVGSSSRRRSSADELGGAAGLDDEVGVVLERRRRAARGPRTRRGLA